MELEAEDIALMRDGWRSAMRVRAMAVGLFYGRLFQISPQSQALFRGDLAAQGRKLAELMDYVILHLDAPETLLPAAEALARRHVEYGVRAEDYASVGQALIWMLERVLKEDFTPAQRLAWGRAYAGLSKAMIAAAYSDRSLRLGGSGG